MWMAKGFCPGKMCVASLHSCVLGEGVVKEDKEGGRAGGREGREGRGRRKREVGEGGNHRKKQEEFKGVTKK